MWISLFQTTEWSSPSLLSWMQCLIQATCSLMLENNHEILHLLYRKLGKAIWAICTQELQCMSQLRWQYAMWSVTWVTGLWALMHAFLDVSAILASEPSETAASQKALNSEREPESKFRVNFTSLFQPASLFLPQYLMSYILQQHTEVAFAELSAGMEHRWWTTFIKAKLISGVPPSEIRQYQLFKWMSTADGSCSTGHVQIFQGIMLCVLKALMAKSGGHTVLRKVGNNLLFSMSRKSVFRVKNKLLANIFLSNML